MNTSRIAVDLMNDSELQRVSDMLVLRKSIRALQEQAAQYDATHARRKASLMIEMDTLQKRIDTLAEGVES